MQNSISETHIPSLAQGCDVKEKCLFPAPDEFCAPGEQSSALQGQQGQCVSCFCAGRSQNCSRANVYRDRLMLEIKSLPRDSKMFLVNVDGFKIPGVKYTVDNHYVAHNVSKGTEYYWALPRAFLGNKLSSYGGKLRYSVKYNDDHGSKGNEVGSLSRGARDLRDVISEMGFGNDYSVDNYLGEEEETDGSGMSTTDSGVTTTSVKMSAKENAAAITQADKVPSKPPSRVDFTTTEPPETFPMSSFLPSGASTASKEKTTTSFVSPLNINTDTPTPELTTILRGSPSSVANTFTDGQDGEDERNVPFSLSAYTTNEAATDQLSFAKTHGEIDVQSVYTSDKDSVETPAPTSGTISQETTAFALPSVKVTKKPTGKAYTTKPDTAFTDFDVEEPNFTEGQIETRSSLSESAYTTDRYTTKVSTIIPAPTPPKRVASTNTQDFIATHMVANTKTYDSESTEELPKDGQDETTPSVPSSAFRTVTSDMTTSGPKSSTEAFSEEETIVTVTSTFRGDGYATEEAISIPDTPFTKADPSTDRDSKEEITEIQGTFPLTNLPLTETVDTKASADTLGHGHHETTIAVYSPESVVESTLPHETEVVPEAFSIATDISTREPDVVDSTIRRGTKETISFASPSGEFATTSETSVADNPISEPSLSYSTVDTNSVETTTIPKTYLILTSQTDPSSSNVKDTAMDTTVVPKRSYTEEYISRNGQDATIDDSTERPKTKTQKTKSENRPSTFQDKTLSYVLASTYSKENVALETKKLKLATETVTYASKKGGEGSNVAVFSAPYSPKMSTAESPTKIPGTSHTVTNLSTERKDIEPRSFYSTEGPRKAAKAPDVYFTRKDTTTLGEDKTAHKVISVKAPIVTDISTSEASTVASSTAYSSGKGFTNEAASRPPTQNAATDKSTDKATQSADEKTTLTRTSSYTAVKTIATDNEGILVMSSTEKGITATDQEDSTSVEYSLTPTSKEMTTLPDRTTQTTAKVTSASVVPPRHVAEAVRMVGKDGTTVYYDEAQPGIANFSSNVEVSFIEGKWRSADGSRISRDTLMRVLSDVSAIYVRAFHGSKGSTPASLRITDVSMDVASERDAGFGKALLIEQCECPNGYSGLSCESCKPGYYRSRDGTNPGTCIKCVCHGHSDDCDPHTGHCKNCKHNTEGFRCEKCQTDFYGNALNGTPSDCKACPCPMTASTNGLRATCFMADDGEPTCDACPQGYGGRTCDKCVNPYEGDPTKPGGQCVLSERLRIHCGCDARGSMNNSCDSQTRQCYCKKHVQGRNCDKCKRSFFNLQSDDPDGCVACFCFGVSKDCKCANLYKDIVHLRFALLDGPDFLRLSDLSRNTILRAGFQVQGEQQYFVFEDFEKIPAGTYYWFLGKEFRGDMITSYDGIMRYKVSHEMSPGGELTTDTDVQITGRGMILKFRHGRRLEVGKNTLYGLKLSEDWLRFPDGSRVTRDHVMTVLSAVDSILVRATYGNTTTRSILYDVTLEKGVTQYTRFGKAKNIEECSCPPEYSGTSCQDCAKGYTRSYPGPDFTPCVTCNCNQHSKECDPENGQCMRCTHRTTGLKCEKCMVGFYGDPTKGTPEDCQECPCPLTNSSNQFSRICKLDSDDKPTCTACQTGYTGRNCERCAKGYIGNPSNPGEKCVKIPVGFLPTVRVRPMKRIKEEGKNALFYCFTGGQQKPTFAWSRKSGEPMSRRVLIKGRRLQIRGVKKGDEGTYLCTASNIYGSEVSSAELVVKDRLEDPIVVTVYPKVLHVPLNQSAEFTCKAKSATDFELKWTRGMHGPLPRGAVNLNGVLKIKNTQSIHGGSYTCTGKNSFSDDMASVQLRVGVTSPQVYISPVRLSVREGDLAQFRCSASGFPAPVLQWHGGPGGRVPPEASSSNGNGLLTFTAVKKIHEGEYFCTASNLGGISSTSAILNVSAAGSVPVISVSPSSLTVTEGEEALFECTARGEPTPTTRWSRENGQFPQSSSSVNGVLRIFPTKSEDEGDYVCTAANSFGAKASLVTLNVERDTSVAPTAIVTPANQTVDEGESTVLLCQVTGDPYPTIQWNKVGSILTGNHVVEGTLLRIQEVTRDDEGMYVCVAQNKKGVKQATGMVTVRKRVMPKIDIMPERMLTVTGGDTAVFRCVVKAGYPPPAVAWEREENKPVENSNDGVLRISEVSGDSQGRYICKATNAIGSTEADAFLIVQGEPKVIVSPSSPVVVTSGSSVTLECAATGDPSPAVNWITPKQQRSASNLNVIESGHGVLKLVIKDTRLNDQGNYTCQAQNRVGVIQESVELIVFVPNEPPEIVVEPSFRAIIEGEKVRFWCNASGIPKPNIIWERLGSNLPDDALIQDGLLTIASVGSDDAGTYICTAVNSEGKGSFSVQLVVIEPPKVDVTPSQISVNEGNSFCLDCVVNPSLPVTWSKINGSIPIQRNNKTGTLLIEKAEVKHAGMYRCNSSNAAGSSEGFARVRVFAAPRVNVWPESIVALPNSNVSLQCNASGIPEPEISWKKDGGDIPNRHSVVQGALKLSGLVSEDDGQYICTASNVAGGSAISVNLIVEAPPSLTIRGGTSVQAVSLAGNLTLECIGKGVPPPKIQWSRNVGPIPQGVTTEDGILMIRNAQHSHGGAYKCEVTNRVGSVHSQIVIIVQEAPKITVIPQKSQIKIGESTEFTCIASGSPVPDLTWRKLNGSLPANSTVQGGVLTITNVTKNDAGLYECSALNIEGSTKQSSLLEVKVPVPRFTQKPLSYLTLSPLTKEPLNVTVEIVFIPEMADGLILYNDQRTNESVGDFISFGMSDGFAEFRFNLGFEPAIIRSQQPLGLYEWHTVVLARNQRKGNLIIDGQPPATGLSKGSSTGLNLNQALYVGGVPDFSAISTLAGFNSGFIGCLSYLAVNGKVTNLGDPLNRVGVEDCEVCQTRPCKNSGTCAEVSRDWGFVCSCKPGYSGKTCHFSGQRCSPGICNGGRCKNIGTDGFRCVCPAGFSGERCEQGIPIDTPMFEGKSFMSFPGIEGAARQLKLSMMFMILKSQKNMLLLYNGQKSYPARGDFISLAINDGIVEFRFDMGSGPGIVRAARKLSLGIWHTVRIERQLDEAVMKFDNDSSVKANSRCCSVGLNLGLDLFIGGVDNFTTIDTNKIGVSTGLFGCISSVSVDGREINLLKSNLNQRGIKQCTECLLPCEINPCLNNATCITVGKTGFVCSCAPGYTGEKCEVKLVVPGGNQTCFHGGVTSTSQERICSCPIGYGGKRCEISLNVGDSVSFSGDGFLEFPASAIRGPRVSKPDYVSLEIKTEARVGVILWQGKRRDHFAIGLREGFLEFRFELGSGPAVLLSQAPVNDGQWHSVEVYRSFREGSLKVDNNNNVTGTSAKASKGLNLDDDSNIIIGGGFNVVDLTYGKFTTGFNGCIRNVHFKTTTINFRRDATRGWNAMQCDGEISET
ncbi:basement membrane-specific heparan sulfate proteoglycan core protein-like isoform X3 [Montipora foliosa]|uniref:basement membrane-specific heparan sulfate proteoglycan core protein-like isoform X3 n=1 Tax=Montipora foliosa TaxID=591990 RepID=UPI0035F16641